MPGKTIMRALVIDNSGACRCGEKNGLHFHSDYPAPSPGRNESRVRVTLAGICGTDLELARGYMNFRGVPGHEFVGTVEESGDKAIIGKRVVGEINAGCGRCRDCDAGLSRHCSDRTVLGILGRDGAFAEYLTLPNQNLHLVPSTVSDQAAVFTEPLAAAYEIFEQLHIPRNKTVLVLGGGRLGALVAMALRAEGYAPMVAGHHLEKLRKLNSIGLDASPEESLNAKFDYVIDCSGRSSGLRRAIGLVVPRGTIILKSTAQAGAEFNLAPIVINEVRIVGSRCGSFEPALSALEANRVDPRPLVSEVFPLEDCQAAMRAAASPGNFKILLKP